MTRVYIVRHGQTDWNAERRLQGSTDVPLNEEGRAQARACAEGLARVIERGAPMLTSPLSRALETARIMAPVLGSEVTVDPRLVERAYGAWEGRTPEERAQVYPQATADWHAGREPSFPGYEGHARVAERASAAILEHVVDDGDLVVVTHGSAGRMATLALMEVPLAMHTVSGLANASWSLLERGRGGRWVLERHNIGPL